MCDRRLSAECMLDDWAVVVNTKRRVRLTAPSRPKHEFRTGPPDISFVSFARDCLKKIAQFREILDEKFP